MTKPSPLVEIWRGPFLESQHMGHAVVCDDSGAVVEAWGNADQTILPRSSCKMLQALPLIESGAADAFSLGSEHLALACASHQGAAIHTDRVQVWLRDLGLTDDAFRCGAQTPSDKDAREALIRAEQEACQFHNNCSGKHCGFLALGLHMGSGPEYIDLDHPTQKAVREAFEDMTGDSSPGYGIDGCSAPNFATTTTGLARAMARMAKPSDTARGRASQQLVNAMREHPELVAGEGRACTELMRAMSGKAVIKTGAEGVFIAILPDQGIGMAVKVSDGATRAAECAIAALLVKYGVLDANHPAAIKRLTGPIRNWHGIETGFMKPSADFIEM